ncbi:hypothetical protein A3F06_02280 [candidate division TM6 bacterium RIFCSPHIGHO2_12_FULL_36_22]|nr:MAG: hypothetical protein A3F06_02280 [candidate division TM6 bacterium RIFCSPHIGHO2_12_FULL_36_22]
MELVISSPLQRNVHDVAWVELNSDVGNLIIQPSHAPMVIALKRDSQVIYGLMSGKQDTITVVSGIAHVTRESVLLLVV